MNARALIAWLALVLAPLLTAVHFAVILFATSRPEGHLFVTVLVSSSIAVTFLAASAFIVSKNFSLERRLAAAATAALALAAATAFFLVTESSRARSALLVAAPIGLAFLLTGLSRAARGDERDRHLHTNIAFFTQVVTAFFALAFAFHSVGYFAIPVIGIAAVLALLGAILAEDAFSVADLGRVVRWSLAGIFGLLLGELYFAMQALPTSASANAVASTTIFAVALHIARTAIAGAIAPRAWRREFAMAAVLVIMVLITAQWA